MRKEEVEKKKKKNQGMKKMKIENRVFMIKGEG